MRWVSSVGGAVLVLTSAPAWPQTSSTTASAPPSAPAKPDLRPIEQVDISDLLNLPVVTASGGQAEERALTPANVISISRDDIQRHGWRSLAEILATVPGLYVIDDFVLPSVGVRGITGGLEGGTRIVKVMINGVPVNFRPDLTAFLGPEYIPVEAIDRVEVAKGPLSALYGANAFLAVVNVITRKPDAEPSAEVALRVNDQGGVGGGASALVQYDDGAKSLLAAANVDRFDRSGKSLMKTFSSQDPSLERYAPLNWGASRNDIAQPASAFVQLQGRSERMGNLTLQAGFQQLDSMGEFQLNSVLTHESRIALENFWSQLKHEKAWSDWVSTSLSVGFASGAPTRDYEQYLTGTKAAVYQPMFDYRAFDAAAEIAFRPSPIFNLSLGADFDLDREQVRYYLETLHSQNGVLNPGDTLDLHAADQPLHQVLSDVGAYAQVTSTPIPSLPGLHVTGNVRADFLNLFPLQTSWRAAIAYRWSEDFTTKVFAGRAFQAPSGVLLFGETGFGSQDNIIGNRTLPEVNPLVPQSVESVEAMGTAKLFGHLGLELGVYGQQIDDRIEFVPSAANFLAENTGRQQNVGLEATGRLLAGRFSVYASASFQQTVVDGQIQPLPPPLYPNAFGVAGIDVDLPEAYLKGNAQVRWAGDRGSSPSNTIYNNLQPYTLPPYADLDLTLASVGLHLLSELRETRVTVAVYNLLDEHHAEPGFGGFDVPNLGRTLLAEVRQQF